jgi:hypothetical protein
LIHCRCADCQQMAGNAEAKDQQPMRSANE